MRPQCQSTDTAADVFCGDCDEHLCNNCAKFHKRSKKLKKHVLITLANKRSTSFIEESIDYKCKGHDKKLKYICLDHNSLGCSLCTITNHKNCKAVKSFREYINTPHCLDDRAQKLNQIHMLSQKCSKIQSHERKASQIENISAIFKEYQQKISVEMNK
ncbi:WECH-like protein, partial [Mya arenaria]